MDKKSLVLGVLLGIIGGIFSSLMTGSFLVIMQLQEASIMMMAIIMFLIFINSFLGLMVFIRWTAENMLL